MKIRISDDIHKHICHASPCNIASTPEVPNYCDIVHVSEHDSHECDYLRDAYLVDLLDRFPLWLDLIIKLGQLSIQLALEIR